MTKNKLSTIDEIIDSFKLGELIILVDDEDRENEGDFIISGEKVTPENTRIYICGYQGTIDGVMDYVADRGFVNRDNPHEDGTFEVKYESYG